MSKARLLPALGAGFGLIRRHPLSTLVWGLVYFILAVSPSALGLLLMGPYLPGIVDWYRQLVTNPAIASNPPAVLQEIQSLQYLQILGSIAAVSIVMTAIQRAVLFPDKVRFFYLRLGMDELRTAVIIVVLYVLMFVALILVTLIITIPAVLLAFTLRNSPAGMAMSMLVTFLIGGGAAAIAIGYPLARLGLAVPMSVYERRFRLFEAWNFTRGYGWRLVGMGVLMILLIIVFELVIFAVLASVGIGMAGGFDAAHLRDFFTGPSGEEHIVGVALVTGLVFGIFSLIIQPVMLAPIAKAYQLIRAETGDESVFG